MKETHFRQASVRMKCSLHQTLIRTEFLQVVFRILKPVGGGGCGGDEGEWPAPDPALDSDCKLISARREKETQPRRGSQLRAQYGVSTAHRTYCAAHYLAKIDSK